MSDHEEGQKPNGFTKTAKDIKLEADSVSTLVGQDMTANEMDGGQPPEQRRSSTNGGIASPFKKPPSQSPSKQSSTPRSPAAKLEGEEVVGGEITVKMEPGQAPKLTRTTSKKITSKPPKLFSDVPDATAEANKSFEQLERCIYANKYLGTTDHALECDCGEEWDSESGVNNACGENSDCINRWTKMECVGDCTCGPKCQNQRFQRRQYAKVSVIKTEKKGYGLRTDKDLKPNQFIYEYIGEVIGENSFRNRMSKYDEEGIKHFYFMSLNKGEFVDATKKGNLGRFCNHSCNPNCYVDKWVVGDKLRMGIFAERKILAGEELVFNYNVDRYGANPQPCYCGEPNCTGYIGGKTQTERATKLSAITIEALGIEDGDSWDTAVASKKSRKKKVEEDDEEYVESVQPKSLDENGANKVMATLMQCKEKWIVVKLLTRIQRCDEERVRNRIVKMHGYQILNSTLSAWIDDDNVVLQVLDILYRLPRITRNKIQDSKIETTVAKLVTNEHEKIKEQAEDILKIWSALEMGYRIPRLKRDPAAVAAQDRTDRDERRRAARDLSKSPSRSRSSSSERDKGPAAPSGPRSSIPQRNHAARPPFRRYQGALPQGWFSAQSNGRTYYYSAGGERRWDRPTAPAQPPPPPKVVSNEQRLQDIIDSITSASQTKQVDSKSVTPKPVEDSPKPVKKEKKEKWKSYSEEKQKKMYENTLFPHVKHVMDKFKGKLEKDDLKRFAKEVAKRLVDSDFKHKRVEDPSKISEKQERQVKKYVKEYFEKAVSKKSEHDKKKVNKKPKELPSGNAGSHEETSKGTDNKKNIDTGDDDIVLSENEIEDEPSPLSPGTGLSPKRKREEADGSPSTNELRGDLDATPSKKVKIENSMQTPPPPPSPPPPPPDDLTPGSKLKRKLDDSDGDDIADEAAFEGNVERSPLKRVKSEEAADRSPSSKRKREADDTPSTTPPIPESGTGPNDDVSNTFTDDALHAVGKQSQSFTPLGSPTAGGFDFPIEKKVKFEPASGLGSDDDIGKEHHLATPLGSPTAGDFHCSIKQKINSPG